MISNPFSTAVANSAGEALANIVIDTVPLTVKGTDLKHAKKVGASMQKMAKHIVWLKLQHKFNFFQKAKLGNVLQWKLKDAGYEESYIKELTQWVLMRLE